MNDKKQSFINKIFPQNNHVNTQALVNKIIEQNIDQITIKYIGEKKKFDDYLYNHMQEKIVLHFPKTLNTKKCAETITNLILNQYQVKFINPINDRVEYLQERVNSHQFSVIKIITTNDAYYQIRCDCVLQVIPYIMSGTSLITLHITTTIYYLSKNKTLNVSTVFTV